MITACIAEVPPDLEEVPPQPLTRRVAEDESQDHRWSIILAGGEGTRLRSLVKRICGDERPKQFCRLFGGKTLLEHTRDRIGKIVPPHRMLYVLMEAHEAHYTAELKGVSPRQMVVQPVNRGTLPAAVFSLLRLTQLDPLAIVAFVPSDHFYEDEAGFRTGLDLAYEIAEDNGGAIVLLGAKASSADVEYGWIEPTKITAIGLGRPRLYRVRNFWEKPSTDVAQSLLEQGCLWNTFTMVGRASTFLRMIEAAAPRVYHAFSRVTHEDRAAIRTVYNALSASDFSRDVLTTSTHMLSVLSLGDLGWSDLGSPGRALDALTRSGLQIVPA